MWGKRTAAFLGCAIVFAACAGAAYDALHPSSSVPDAVLIWPSPHPVLKPLLVSSAPAEKKTTLAQQSASWPSDPSSAAVPFLRDMIELAAPRAEDDDDSAPRTTETPPPPEVDRAQDAAAQKLPDKPPGVSTETTGQAGSRPPDVEKTGGSDDRAHGGTERRRYWHYYRYYRHRSRHR